MGLLASLCVKENALNQFQREKFVDGARLVQAALRVAIDDGFNRLGFKVRTRERPPVEQHFSHVFG